jgi:hypothetical protein
MCDLLSFIHLFTFSSALSRRGWGARSQMMSYPVENMPVQWNTNENWIKFIWIFKKKWKMGKCAGPQGLTLTGSQDSEDLKKSGRISVIPSWGFRWDPWKIVVYTFELSELISLNHKYLRKVLHNCKVHDRKEKSRR